MGATFDSAKVSVVAAFLGTLGLGSSFTIGGRTGEPLAILLSPARPLPLGAVLATPFWWIAGRW